MEIVDRGYVARCVAGTERAVLGFPSVTALSDGTLLATCRTGTTKDSADEAVEVYRSSDRRTWDGPVHRFGATRLKGRLGAP